MKKIGILLMMMALTLLSASCTSGVSAVNEPVNVFNLDSVIGLLDFNKDDITILSEKDELLTFALDTDEDIRGYIKKFEDLGFQLEDEGGLLATISVTYILENENVTVAITSISTDYMDLYRQAHSDDIEGVERLTDENTLFQITKDTSIYDNEEPEDEAEAAINIPELYLNYTTDGVQFCAIPVQAGSATWTYDNGDGTSTGIAQDGLHPLDSIGIMPELKKTHQIKSIALSFTNTPDSFTVRRWASEYANNPDAYEQYYEEVAVTNGVITVPEDEQEYIYEVYAEWRNGSANYAFYIANEQ